MREPRKIEKNREVAHFGFTSLQDPPPNMCPCWRDPLVFSCAIRPQNLKTTEVEESRVYVFVGLFVSFRNIIL